MNKIKDWMDRKLFKLQTGHDIYLANGGKPMDQFLNRAI